MAFNPPALYDNGTSTSIGRNSAATRTQVGRLGPQSGAPSLAMLTPLSWDESTGKWNVWGGTSEVQTITIDATGGTFTITWNGETTAAIAWNASGATVLAALEALSNVEPGDIASVSLASLVYTITFGGRYAGLNVPAVTTGAGSLTGGAGTATVATGTGGENLGRYRIRGFLWGDQEALVTHATNDTLATIAVEGDFYYAELLAAMPSSETEATFKAALRVGTRELDLRIHELADVR